MEKSNTNNEQVIKNPENVFIESEQKIYKKDNAFWEQYTGKYDEDGFYILSEKEGYYDPLGVYFD